MSPTSIEGGGGLSQLVGKVCVCPSQHFWLPVSRKLWKRLTPNSIYLDCNTCRLVLQWEYFCKVKSRSANEVTQLFVFGLYLVYHFLTDTCAVWHECSWYLECVSWTQSGDSVQSSSSFFLVSAFLKIYYLYQFSLFYWSYHTTQSNR